jgi:hypothetical protein
MEEAILMRQKILSFIAFFTVLLSGLMFSSSIDAQTTRGTYTTTADVH